ncbi:unnamed protein product [Rotaria sp. Silwood1]|nr:unnamed protein product [Rotaria sp. Silwood1]
MQYHTGKSISELHRRVQKYGLPELINFISNVPTWDPMMTRNADYLDQHTLADLMKPWIRNSGCCDHRKNSFLHSFD